MKFNVSYLFIIIILALLIFLSMSNTYIEFKPYTVESPYVNYAVFENFAESKNKPEYATDPVNNPFMNTSNMNVSQPDFAVNEDMPNMQFMENFTQRNVDINDYSYNAENPIDVFGGTDGNNNCNVISSGLTNNKGGLCLNSHQQMLLRTRGGNATGIDSEIGY